MGKRSSKLPKRLIFQTLLGETSILGPQVDAVKYSWKRHNIHTPLDGRAELGNRH
jgi:hypothetical protein